MTIKFKETCRDHDGEEVDPPLSLEEAWEHFCSGTDEEQQEYAKHILASVSVKILGCLAVGFRHQEHSAVVVGFTPKGEDRLLSSIDGNVFEDEEPVQEWIRLLQQKGLNDV